MLVVCVLPKTDAHLAALAEACLAFGPQVALSHEAVFFEVAASQRLFTLEQCLEKLQAILRDFELVARIGTATDLPSALAFARYGATERERLPVEALGDYLSPLAPADFPHAAVLRRLGLRTIGEFLQVPPVEIPARFGKEGAQAYAKLLEAKRFAWPRFVLPSVIRETAELDGAAQIETLEPIFFILKTLVDRVFHRLLARREKIVGFTLSFHLNRFSAHARTRELKVQLPLPQSDPRSVLQFLQERITKELERRPLEEALEGLSLEVTETAPFLDAQRDFFSKVEEEKEGWASLLARLRERLGENSSFLAAPSPRLLPEAAWEKSTEPGQAELMPVVSERPLRMLRVPVPLERNGDELRMRRRHWRITSFEGPERLQGEWWLSAGGFSREYFRVGTEHGPLLWVFRDPSEPNGTLFLHGFYD